MTERSGKKLSHAAKGIIMIFAAIPIIVIIKNYYDDHFFLGLAASLLLAFGTIELGKQDGSPGESQASNGPE